VPAAKPFNPYRPSPTADQADTRTIYIVVALVVMQAIFNGLQLQLPAHIMKFVWWGFAFIAGIGTLQTERYLARRRRLQ